MAIESRAIHRVTGVQIDPETVNTHLRWSLPIGTRQKIDWVQPVMAGVLFPAPLLDQEAYSIKVKVATRKFTRLSGPMFS